MKRGVDSIDKRLKTSSPFFNYNTRANVLNPHPNPDDLPINSNTASHLKYSDVQFN